MVVIHKYFIKVIHSSVSNSRNKIYFKNTSEHLESNLPITTKKTRKLLLRHFEIILPRENGENGVRSEIWMVEKAKIMFTIGHCIFELCWDVVVLHSVCS